MSLTVKLGRASPSVFASARPLRIRPGDQPLWFDSSGDDSQFGLWRNQAEHNALPVDAWVSLLLEASLVVKAMQASDIVGEQILRAAVERAPSVLYLPRGDDLRRWLDQLEGRLAPEPVDELPEIVLPVRLAAQLPIGASLADHLRLDLAQLALAAERRAASEGLTMECWVLRAALGA